MKNAIIMLVTIVAVSGVVLADDYIRIDVDSIPTGSDNVVINFWILRECPTPDPILGASNGFILSNGGTAATWEWVETAVQDPNSSVDWNVGGFMCWPQDIDGISPDSFYVGGAASSAPYGMPVIYYEEPYFSITLNVGNDPGIIYIDSGFVLPAGSWKFSEMTCGVVPGAPNRPSFRDKYGNDYDPGTSPYGIPIYIYDACEPPVITNCPYPDTLQTDNCGKVAYQFNADPPDANFYWESDPFTNGQIDSATGLFTFSTGFPSVYAARIFAVNANCNPPIADTCEFYIGSDLLKLPLKSALMSLFPTKSDREMYVVFGPEGAESVAVWIKIEGSTSELTAMGVKLQKTGIENEYVAEILIEDYMTIQAIEGVIYISPQSRMKKSNGKYTFGTTLSPDLDVSTGYFFADSARSLYGVDGTGVIIGVIDEEIDPTRADFYFDQGDSKVLYFWDQDESSGSVGGFLPAWPFNYGREWKKLHFDVY